MKSFVEIIDVLARLGMMAVSGYLMAEAKECEEIRDMIWAIAMSALLAVLAFAWMMVHRLTRIMEAVESKEVSAVSAPATRTAITYGAPTTATAGAVFVDRMNP